MSFRCFRCFRFLTALIHIHPLALINSTPKKRDNYCLIHLFPLHPDSTAFDTLETANP